MRGSSWGVEEGGSEATVRRGDRHVRAGGSVESSGSSRYRHGRGRTTEASRGDGDVRGKVLFAEHSRRKVRRGEGEGARRSDSDRTKRGCLPLLELPSEGR